MIAINAYVCDTNITILFRNGMLQAGARSKGTPAETQAARNPVRAPQHSSIFEVWPTSILGETAFPLGRTRILLHALAAYL